MIEITLFSQINANFNQYLGLMSTMEDLDSLIEAGISKIAESRLKVQRLRDLFLKQAEKVSHLMKKQKSLNKTIEILAVANTLTKLPERLRAIRKGKRWNLYILQTVTESKNIFDVVSKLACISRFIKEIGLVHE
jgi:peptidoglycan hydrolase CwlO-like protein